MSNNCCATVYVDGGTWVDTTLINPNIMGATLTDTILRGGVTLDPTTANSIATQICVDMGNCIQDYVDGGTFSDITLNSILLNMSTIVNATITGAVELDAIARTSVANAICADLVGCITSTIEAAALTALNVTNASLTNTKLLGTLTLSPDAAQAVFSAITTAVTTKVNLLIQAALQALTPEDIGAVNAVNGAATGLTITGGNQQGVAQNGGSLNNATGSNNVFSGTRLEGPTTVTGQIPFDTAALSHLCLQLQPCIATAIDSVANSGAIAGVFQDCVGAPRAPGVRIPSCEDMNSAITTAISNLPAVDLISNFKYDEATNVLTLTTRLDDGTEQSWDVHLDSLGGQVVTDNVTISGNGTTGSALRVILTETTAIRPITTGTDLPTGVHGARTALLGQPDKWLNIGGYIIPTYNQP